MAEEQNSLELLIRHELAIKQLYELFAMVFPEHRDFWVQLTEEEQKHADCLEGMPSKESLKTWFMNDSRFRRLAIRSSTEYLEQQIQRVKNANITLLEALSIASDLEEALIEKQIISLNMSGPAEIRNVMKGLVADTQRHRKMIAEKLNLHRGETR